MLRTVLIIGMIVFFFFLNLLAMMHMLPIYITSPLLFLSILFALYRLNHRKRLRVLKKACASYAQAFLNYEGFTFERSSSISFSFSSNILQAASIGSGDVISTPAFFSMSIGYSELPAFKNSV